MAILLQKCNLNDSNGVANKKKSLFILKKILDKKICVNFANDLSALNFISDSVNSSNLFKKNRYI